MTSARSFGQDGMIRRFRIPNSISTVGTDPHIKSLADGVNKSVKNGHLKKTPSYGRIEISTIGGIFMPRKYRHIEQYTEEILRLKTEGKTRAEIGAKLGFSKEQIHNFISRYNERQRKISAGITIQKRGRPAKDSVVPEEDTLADLRYKLARKDARIKQLEMENKLMRDFLSLTERK